MYIQFLSHGFERSNVALATRGTFIDICSDPDLAPGALQTVRQEQQDVLMVFVFGSTEYDPVIEMQEAFLNLGLCLKADQAHKSGQIKIDVEQHPFCTKRHPSGTYFTLGTQQIEDPERDQQQQKYE